MQPGDSIIGKMKEGLEQYTTFSIFCLQILLGVIWLLENGRVL